MALYENVFIARQDVPATQVETLTNEFAELVTAHGRHRLQEGILGPALARLPYQEEPQGPLHPAQHRRAVGCREGARAHDVDQRRHHPLPDRPRRRARGRPVGRHAAQREKADRPGGDRGDRGGWGDRPPRRERPRFGDDAAPAAAIVPGEEE